MKRIFAALVFSAALLAGTASAQQVNLLCSPDLAWCEALGPAFEAATGHELEFIRLSSQDALARIRAETVYGSYGAPIELQARRAAAVARRRFE